MLRLASLLVVVPLVTGCISGIDQKPYDVRIGPSIEPDAQFMLVVAALLVGVACAGAYVVVDSAR